MNTIDLNITDGISNDLQRLAAEVEAPQIREAAGLAAVEEVKAHFTRLDAERPNKLGGKRQHFFAQAAESALWMEQGADVVVDVSEPLGLRQAIQGGPILPGPGKKYLTIPAIAEAYGHRAGEFSNLRLLFRRKDGAVEAYALAEAQQQEVKIKDGKVRKGALKGMTVQRSLGGATIKTAPTIFFWLVKAVNQTGDGSIAPDPAAVAGRAMGAVRQYLSGLQGGVKT